MSGSRDHFTEKLRQELQSALALLTRSLAQRPVDLTLPVTLTIFQVAIEVDTYPVSPAMEAPPAHTARALKQDLPVQRLPLQVEARISEATGTMPEAVLHQVAMRETLETALHVVNCTRFTPQAAESLSQTLPVDTIEPPAVFAETALQMTAPACQSPPAAEPLSTEARPLVLPSLRRRSLGMPTPMYALPLRKSPIPPHRFTGQQRERFKRALAEKSATEARNIQLGIVFDRMDMALFSSISQDENGHLLCYPKVEPAENQRSGPRRRPPGNPAYLVFGTRLDTGEAIKTLVPVEQESAS